MHLVHIVTIKELQPDGSWVTLSDSFYEVEHVTIKADRGAQQNASNLLTTTKGQTSTSQQNAAQERGTLLPMLQREATGTSGLAPTQKNEYMVSAEEAGGGSNAGLTGEANLATARTRNAGGFGSALDEASRQKQRQLATTTQNVNNLNTQIALDRQRQAQQQLQGLYGTDTSAGLQAMGLQSQAIQDELAAGRQGWLQNTEGVLNTIGGMGRNAAGAYHDLGLAS